LYSFKNLRRKNIEQKEKIVLKTAIKKPLAFKQSGDELHTARAHFSSCVMIFPISLTGCGNEYGSPSIKSRSTAQIKTAALTL